MGFGHALATLMPAPVSRSLRPKWHMLQVLRRLRRHGGKVAWDRELGCWTVTKLFGQKVMTFPVASYRDVRRMVTFDHIENDNVFPWLESISDCTTLYDFGPSAGLESLTAHAHHNCEAVMIELFTPSMMAILRGIVLAGRAGRDRGKLHPILAGGDREPGFGRVLMHQPPVFGGTFNSFQYLDDYARGGRSDKPVFAHQWAMAVSIDSLHTQFGFKPPTHVKMDIDGFERRVMEGATETLKAGHVRSWSIEVSTENFEWIPALMKKNNYVEIDRFDHYPGLNDCLDLIFAREDLAQDYRERMKPAQARLAQRVRAERR